MVGTLLEMSVPGLGEFRGLVPVLIVFGAACLGVLVEAFVPKEWRDESQLFLTVGALVGGFIAVIAQWGTTHRTVAALGTVAVDGPTKFWWGLVLVFALLSAFMFAERKLYGGHTTFAPMAAAAPNSPLEAEATATRNEHTEVFPLLMFAVVGMMLFPAANDLIMMFIALEVLSLPLYLLSGLNRTRRLMSQEAALKYFLLGAISSAIFLFGAALLFGYSGSFQFSAISSATANPGQSTTLLVAGMTLMIVGLLFKLGAVPFHSWTPDVYTGAPTPVTAFMAVCTKIAAVGALVRILFVAFDRSSFDWQPAVAGVAILTMAVGSVLAIVQNNIKRMLAYSSVAHAGFILTAVVGFAAGAAVPAGQMGSVASIGFYLAAYGFATLGAFAIVSMLRTKQGMEADNIEAWRGIGRSHPVLGAAMVVFMLSFAGIPLTAGFIGKWAVFLAAWRGGYGWLVLVAVLLSLVAAVFYLRVVAVMFFSEPTEDAAEVAAPGIGTWSVITVGAVFTVLLGILPGWVLDLAAGASQLLR